MTSSIASDPSFIRPEVRIFFRDIKEHPDDDTPRLIFADWLQEHGDVADAARGEFLRSCVLRHRLSPDDPNHNILKRREGELFTEHRWAWLGPLADQARGWGFERGLIQIEAQAGKLLIPEVSSWARTEAGLWIDALKLPEIYRGTGNRWIVETPVDRLSYSPLLTQLNRLDVSSNANSIGLALVFRALRARRLPCLHQLLLSHNRLTTEQAVSLTRCRDFRRLTLLDLRHNRLDDAAARMLVDSPYLKSLTTLRLGHNRFTAVGIALLRQAFGDRVEL
jgi:uncharacterized protein (TIGR02996 family)